MYAPITYVWQPRKLCHPSTQLCNGYLTYEPGITVDDAGMNIPTRQGVHLCEQSIHHIETLIRRRGGYTHLALIFVSVHLSATVPLLVGIPDRTHNHCYLTYTHQQQLTLGILLLPHSL